MNMTHTVYVKLDEITELTHKDILLKDVAQVYCRDQNIQNKCSVCRIMTVRSDEAHRYVMSALDVTKKLEALDPGIEVEHMGKTDFIFCTNNQKHCFWIQNILFRILLLQFCFYSILL